MGTIEIEGQKFQMDAFYFPDQAQYYKSDDDPNVRSACTTPNSICAIELQISFLDSDVGSVADAILTWTQKLMSRLGLAVSETKTKDDNMRMRIQHFSSQITGAQISGNYLLVSDANGQTWRYSIGTKSILPLLADRWYGLSPTDVDGPDWSQECLRMQCEGVKVPNWPQ
jgi:hypothetical protein